MVVQLDSSEITAYRSALNIVILNSVKLLLEIVHLVVLVVIMALVAQKIVPTVVWTYVCRQLVIVLHVWRVLMGASVLKVVMKIATQAAISRRKSVLTDARLDFMARIATRIVLPSVTPTSVMLLMVHVSLDVMLVSMDRTVINTVPLLVMDMYVINRQVFVVTDVQAGTMGKLVTRHAHPNAIQMLVNR